MMGVGLKSRFNFSLTSNITSWAFLRVRFSLINLITVGRSLTSADWSELMASSSA